MSQAQDKQIPAVKVDYGHNGECVLVIFDKQTEALAFTPAQVEAHIRALTHARQELHKHKAQKR